MYKLFSIALVSLCIVTSLYGQTNYYVSTLGSDFNSGLSVANAWQTIQHAVDNIGPGAIVNILGGEYNERVEIFVSGTAAAPITIKNFDGNPAILDGTGASPNWDAMLAIFDQDYITIEGLVIRDNVKNDAQGILVEGDCQNITIRNNEIYNISYANAVDNAPCPSKNSQPIIVYGTANNAITDLVIENNIIHDCNVGCSEGLAVNGYVDRFTVDRNKVYNINNIGIDIIGGEGTGPIGNDFARGGFITNNEVYNCKSPYATAAGIYSDGATDIFIENNLVYDNQWGIEVGCENVGFTSFLVTVQNNFIYNNDDAGLSIGGFDFPGGSGKVVAASIINNTLYNNDKLLTGVGGTTGDVNLSYTEFTTIGNNLVLSTNQDNLLLYEDNVNSPGLVMDYNLYYLLTNPGSPEWEFGGTIYTSLAAFQTGTSLEANSIYADPQLADLSTFDLHLSSSSPAIDAGFNNYFNGLLDFDGDARILFGRIDIGADEFTGVISANDVNFEVSPICIEVLYDPTPTLVTLDGNFSDATIDILDATMTSIFTVPQSNGPYTIDTSLLGAGTHFVRIMSDTFADMYVIQMIK